MNQYITKKATILNIKKHTENEWTFTVEANTKGIAYGKFYQLSLPKIGECPISVTYFTDNTIDFTIRAVGKVTNEMLDYNIGDNFFIRGPYGNGFDVSQYEDKDIIVVAGGSGVAPVYGIMEHFYNNPDKFKSFKLIAGFRNPEHILFKDSIEKWSKKLNVTLTVDSADDSYKKETGLVTKYIPDIKIDNEKNVCAIVVGPPIMMKFAVAELLKRGIKDEQILVSYERKMSCGVGKCGHCKMDSTYICLDGPVFTYSFAKNLID